MFQTHTQTQKKEKEARQREKKGNESKIIKKMKGRKKEDLPLVFGSMMALTGVAVSAARQSRLPFAGVLLGLSFMAFTSM